MGEFAGKVALETLRRDRDRQGDRLAPGARRGAGGGLRAPRRPLQATVAEAISSGLELAGRQADITGGAEMADEVRRARRGRPGYRTGVQEMPQSTGFIGLGAMGMPMALRLAAAGHRLRGLRPRPGARRTGGARMTASRRPTAARRGGGAAARCCSPACPTRARSRRSTRRSRARARRRPPAGRRLLDDRPEPRAPPASAARRARRALCRMPDAGRRRRGGERPAVLHRLRRRATTSRRCCRCSRRSAAATAWSAAPAHASRFKVVQNGLGLVQLAAIAEALAILAKAGADLGAFCEVVAAGHGMADTPLFRAKAPLMLARRAGGRGPPQDRRQGHRPRAALARELGLAAPLLERADELFAAAHGAGPGRGRHRRWSRARSSAGPGSGCPPSGGPADARADGRDRDRGRPMPTFVTHPEGESAARRSCSTWTRSASARSSRTWRGGSARSATTCCCRTCSIATAGRRSIRRCCRRRAPIPR